MTDSHPTVVKTESLAALSAAAADAFRLRSGCAPQWLVAAPGRVNLIGEHTDYNDGYALPMAIERYVVIAAAPCADRRGTSEKQTAADADTERMSRFYSVDFDDEAEIRVGGRIEPGPVAWSSYVQGVVAGYVARGFELPPFSAVIRSTVPAAAGLSSSAALEVATATLLESILATSLDPSERALLCQEAEHKFAGVPCGIMDQFSSVFGQEDALMLLDCRSQAVELVPLRDPGVTVLIANSNVRRELTGGEYAERRAHCEEAAAVLGVPALRDVSIEALSAAGVRLDAVHTRRARHVITEIERTLQAVDAIRAGDWNRVGELMYASHASLRDDYEVSCDELDLLVELAGEIGSAGGVFGSRVTGAGFGGCTVSLVRTKFAAEIAQEIRDRYFEKTGIVADLFASRPAKGAHAIRQKRKPLTSANKKLAPQGDFRLE